MQFSVQGKRSNIAYLEPSAPPTTEAPRLRRTVRPTRATGVTQVPGMKMLYMVIENFRGGNPLPVYRRFRDHGRLAPEGLKYVASWVTEDLSSLLPDHGMR